MPTIRKEAKRLLTEAGYPNGFDTPCYNLTTPREPNVKEMGEAVFAYPRRGRHPLQGAGGWNMAPGSTSAGVGAMVRRKWTVC